MRLLKKSLSTQYVVDHVRLDPTYCGAGVVFQQSHFRVVCKVDHQNSRVSAMQISLCREPILEANRELVEHDRSIHHLLDPRVYFRTPGYLPNEPLSSAHPLLQRFQPSFHMQLLHPGQ
jgi:hypothetical protein